MTYRDAASFGKREEYAAVARLLRLGFDVYMTLVDDQQIDCVIRKEVNGTPVYMDIQIKARSSRCKPRSAGTFAAMEIRNPRENFFFIFYSEQADCYWVVPSLELIKEANVTKGGKTPGRYRMVFTNYSEKRDKVTPRPKFEKYRDNFDILKRFGA